MKIETINSFERLQQLHDQWTGLALSIPDLTPFQLPEWQLTWWEQFGGGELRTLAFWSLDRLVGLLPMFLHNWNGARQLTLLGSGVSDFLDPCFRPDLTGQIILSINSALTQWTDWDCCDWQDLRADTPLKSNRGFNVQVHDNVSCSAIPLASSFEEYWRARSSDLRRNLTRYAKKAEAEAPLHFEVHAQADSVLLGQLIDLHGQRWQKQGQPGMVVTNQSEAFLRIIAARFTELESFRLFSLRWKETPVAMSAGFALRDTLYSYLSAFHPQYEILGFGRNLLMQSLRYAQANGFKSWNFLRGDEPYKTSWGAVSIPRCRLLIQRS